MKQKGKDNRMLNTFSKKSKKQKKRTKVGLRVRPAMLVALKMKEDSCSFTEYFSILGNVRRMNQGSLCNI